MSLEPDPPPPSRDVQNEQAMYRYAGFELRRTLPPPVVDTDAAWADRDIAARAKVAALVPVSAVELDLAVHHVAAMAHAAECLSQVGEVIGDRKEAGKLRSQAASMGREARGYLSKLQSVQRMRERREDNDARRDSAHLSEHCTLGLMTEAMDALPARPPVRQMTEEAAPAADVDAAAVAPAEGVPGAANPPAKAPFRIYEEWTDEEKRLDLLRWTTDRWAIQHSLKAKLIRQLGGLPPDCTFEPPPPEVLYELIHRQDGGVTWVDDEEPWVPPSPG